MKRTPLKRTGKLKHKRKTPEESQQQVADVLAMWKFFEEIWNERPHKSEVSGEWLGNTINSMYFDHLLEKSKYPELKHEKNNIALVTPEEHAKKTNGFALPRHQELINDAKKQFGIV